MRIIHNGKLMSSYIISLIDLIWYDKKKDVFFQLHYLQPSCFMLLFMMMMAKAFSLNKNINKTKSGSISAFFSSKNFLNSKNLKQIYLIIENIRIPWKLRFVLDRVTNYVHKLGIYISFSYYLKSNFSHYYNKQNFT